MNRLLVVDDDPAWRALYRLAFEGPFELFEATDAQEALAMLGAVQCPDVILLDLRMPRMSGLDFIHRLDRKGIRIPIVVCSGVVSEGEPALRPERCEGGPEKVRSPRAPGGTARGRPAGRRGSERGTCPGAPGRYRLARLNRPGRSEASAAPA